MNRIWYCVLFCCLFPSVARAIVKGSESAVSVEPYIDFPVSDTDNTMLGFAWFKNGFGLEDATTHCTFNSVYPIAGMIHLRGGTLTLTNDLVFENHTTIASFGSIIGNGHSIVLPKSVAELPASTKILKDAHIFFQRDIDLLSTVTIQGYCIIDGNNNAVGLDEGGGFIIDSGATLELRNLVLEGVGNNNIHCVDDTGHLILDGVTWCQVNDLVFDHGDILFQRHVDFVGTVTLFYESPMTSTIDNESIWFVGGGLTLSIGKKKSDGGDPLYFYDEESILSLGECSLTVTNNGLPLTRGRLEFLRDIIIDGSTTNTTFGITLGDGVSQENDMQVYLAPGANVAFHSGWLTYNNVHADCFYAGSPSARFTRHVDSCFYIARNCLFPECMLFTYSINGYPPPTIFGPGATIMYDNTQAVSEIGSFFIKASRIGNFCVLKDNDAILFNTGIFAYPVKAMSSKNTLRGNASLTQPIILNGASVVLNMAVDGFILNNIYLNGGTVNLGANLTFGRGYTFASTGTVNLDKYRLSFGSRDFTVTTTTLWIADDAAIDLRSEVTLTSLWTFSGNVMINGNNNPLLLAPGGKIVLAPGAHVTFKDTFIKQTGPLDIICSDDTCCITLDDVYWIQNDNYNFATGSLEIKNDVFMVGKGYSFVYASTQTTRVHDESNWIFSSDITFSYVPLNGDPALIRFDNRSSQLILDGATIVVGAGGLQLTNGQLEVTANAHIYTTKIDDGMGNITDHGISLGDDNPDHDCCLVLANRANVALMAGSLQYHNSKMDSLHISAGSDIYCASSTTLFLYQDLFLQQGTITFGANAVLAQALGKRVYGSINNEGSFAIVTIE